jgi:hypothetical protein
MELKNLLIVGSNIETLYNFFLINPDYKAECVADLMSSQAGQIVKCPTQEEFINKLLIDDEFYQKWGNDCCETMTDEERLDWMRNNKTKTILPMRDPNVEFTMDEFFRPYGVPKRKLKEDEKI